jgi:hypothetical protein
LPHSTHVWLEHIHYPLVCWVLQVVGVMAAADVDHAPRLDIFTNGNAGEGIFFMELPA